MRRLSIAIVSMLALTQAAHAQSGGGQSCAGNPAALGVSRVVEIDTQGGPKFGQQQYKDVSFLRDGEVVLTFDDGPLRHNTRMVLDALAAHCTRATFFVVGRMAVSDPETVREMLRRGHTVGTHTWSHRNLRTLSSEAAQKEIELGFSAVRMAAGMPIAPFFRFPYLSDSARTQHHLRSRDMGIFSIDVDALDYRTQSAQVVIDRVMRGLESRKKGIVLFHDIQPSTARGLKSLLDRLAQRQFRIVHLVPKGKATTIASYDALAEREFQRRKTLLAANPMAGRAMTWLQSGQVQVTKIAPASGQPLPPVPVAEAPPPPRYGQPAPQPVQQATAPPPPAVVIAPRPRVSAEPTWQQRAFGTTF